MKETDKAYLAGIIDGEGTISINREGNAYMPVLSVSSNNVDVLHFIKSLVNGGSLCKKRKYKECHNQSYVYKLVYDKALKLVEEVMPYLIIKKEHAKLLMSYKQSTVRNGRYSEDVWAKKMALVNNIRKLNFRGTNKVSCNTPGSFEKQKDEDIVQSI